jgi:monothiol bacilliredoxin
MIQWLELASIDTLDSIKQASFSNETRAVAIFKHSTRCPVSSMTKRMIERDWNVENVPMYFLDIIAHRDISNKIEADYSVTHQSPQMLVIKNGECIYHESHHSISARDAEQAISALPESM